MDITTSLILTLIGIIIGFLVGMLVASLRAGQGKQPPAEPVNIETQTPDSSIPSGHEGMIRMWYEAGTQQLVVETNDQTYASAEDLPIDELHRLVATTSDLSNWLGILPHPNSSTRVNSEHLPTPDQLIATSAAQASPTQSTPNILEELQRSRRNPLKTLLRAFEETSVAKIEPVTPTIAAQIDEILQKKLENTPYADSGIRLEDTPGQGVVMMVGLDQYEGVESVPDEAIRNLIREAVADWEKLMLGK